MQTKFATPYNNKRIKQKDVQYDTKNKEQFKSRTQQQFKDECNINNVIAKYDKTGIFTHVNEAQAHYFDNTKINEYQESLNLVIQSKLSFSKIPAEIRKRFGNDAGLYLEFVTNPDNMDEMVKMGLAKAPIVIPEHIQKVEVTNTEKKEEIPQK